MEARTRFMTLRLQHGDKTLNISSSGLLEFWSGLLKGFSTFMFYIHFMFLYISILSYIL